jgi:hypothetical protein
LYRVTVRNRQGEASEAILEIRYRHLLIRTARAKKKRYPEMTVTVIEARKRQMPTDREWIDWKLVTDLAVNSRRQAVEKVQWYALRWKIEVFHKILKSGCRAEQVRLRTAPRLINLLTVFCILSWRIFWLTMTNRIAPRLIQTGFSRVWSCAFWIDWSTTTPQSTEGGASSHII